MARIVTHAVTAVHASADADVAACDSHRLRSSSLRLLFVRGRVCGHNLLGRLRVSLRQQMRRGRASLW
jgi:hypothetical protein